MCTACELLPRDHAVLEPSSTSIPSKEYREWNEMDSAEMFHFGQVLLGSCLYLFL